MGDSEGSADNAQYQRECVLHAFDFKPLDLKRELDKYVIGQEAAKKAVATALCTHYRKIQYEECHGMSKNQTPKSNIMLIGPTGTGKTTILKHATKIIGMPFIETDATQYTSTGYYGKDVDDMLQGLYNYTKGNAALTELGIIFIDEIDKIAAARNEGRDVRGEAVQEELLKILEGREIETSPCEKKMRGSITIDTKHILFVLSGAFEGMEYDRKQSIGFGNQEEDERKGSRLYQALVNFGFMPQFLARVPCLATLEELSEEHMQGILTLDGSDIRIGKVNEFAGYDIALEFEDSGIAALAKKAHAKGIGGRGIKHTLDEVFSDFLFYLPSTGINELKVTDTLVNNPQAALEGIIKKYPLAESPVVEEREDVLKKAGQGRIVRKISDKAIIKYERELSDAGLPRKFIREAAEYGLRNNFEPELVQVLLTDYCSEMKEYKMQFQEKWRKKISFTNAVQNKLINIAFRTDATLADAIERNIGDYIDNDEVMGQGPCSLPLSVRRLESNTSQPGVGCRHYVYTYG